MSTDLVPSGDTGDTPDLVPAELFKGKRRIALYLDTATEEVHAMLTRAMTADEPPNWRDYLGKTINCIGIVAWTRKVSKADEPEKWGTYLALFTDEGEVIKTAGTGPAEDLPLLAAQFGEPPWPGGVPVTLTKQGRRYGLFPGWMERTPIPGKDVPGYGATD